MREGGLEPKVATTLWLDTFLVVEVDSTSKSEDAREVEGNILAVEGAALETSTSPVAGESVPVQVGGEDASGNASSSTSLAKEIAQVARELKDWFSKVTYIMLYFFS